MATSGTKTFDLTIANAVDEAFERIGVAPSSLNADKLISARRSLDLLFIEWENEFTFQCKIDEEVVTLNATDASYTLPADVVDVVCAITRINGRDFPMNPISRQEYHHLHDKALNAERPTMYFVDKQRDAPVISVFPLADSANVTMRLYVLRRAEDAGAARYTPDLAKRFYPAICAGLAWKLSEKHAPEKYAEKKREAAEAIAKAGSRDAERSDVRIRVNFSRRRW